MTQKAQVSIKMGKGPLRILKGLSLYYRWTRSQGISEVTLFYGRLQDFFEKHFSIGVDDEGEPKVFVKDPAWTDSDYQNRSNVTVDGIPGEMVYDLDVYQKFIFELSKGIAGAFRPVVPASFDEGEVNEVEE